MPQGPGIKPFSTKRPMQIESILVQRRSRSLMNKFISEMMQCGRALGIDLMKPFLQINQFVSDVLNIDL